MIYLLPHALERAAERFPDQDAFRAPNEALSYRQLEQRSNQLAWLLLEEGVKRGDRVGIFMPRAVDSALAAYGIMKAGAAFVPIDPHMPVAGLRSLMADCGIEVVITHSSCGRSLEKLAAQQAEDALPEGRLCTAVGPKLELEAVRCRSWSELDLYDAGSAPSICTVEDDIAYLMYSSGSTGRPKGIVHTHRSGLAYVRLSVDTYDLGPQDRVGNHSPLHFDMSTFGYLSSPYAGATTVLIPEAYTKLTASLSQLMADERLTIWYSVPLALIQLLLRGVLEERDLRSLRWVLFGGEPYARKHMEALMALWPGARFSNVYGPAEVNQCTYFHVPPLVGAPCVDAAAEPVPIGKAWDNTEALVLDDEDRPVAVGDSGELVVRSPTMMQGYWGRPDLDAKAYYRVDSEAPGAKVFYRTGDLVQLLDDGEMLFIGRKDRQVKVRGYRLELDEIERTLVSHPLVEEAAVFPVRVNGQIEHLEAVVTVASDGAPAADSSSVAAEALRAFLAERVSWYAVPAAVDVESEFPRTTSGKIDRRRLQQLAEGRVDSDE